MNLFFIFNYFNHIMRFFISTLMLNYFLLLKDYVELPKHFYQPLKSDIPIIVVSKDKIKTNIKIVMLKFSHNGYITCILKTIFVTIVDDEYQIFICGVCWEMDVGEALFIEQ